MKHSQVSRNTSVLVLKIVSVITPRDSIEARISVVGMVNDIGLKHIGTVPKE